MTDDAAAAGPGAPPDPVAQLDDAAWTLAAVIATYRDAAGSSLAEALTADPGRAAVLTAAGLARDTGHGVVPGPALLDGPLAGNVAAARLSSLRQAVEVAAGAGQPGWSGLPDEVLLDQGHASAATGHALATRLVPALPGLAGRLAAPGGRILDIGTGVGALALALAQDFPRAHVTGIDVLARAIELARSEVRQAGTLAERVELRQQDAADLREPAAYDLVWLPAPFLPEPSLDAALPHVVAATAPGGWLVAGTNPPPAGPVAAAVARWNAARNGGNALTADDVAARLRDLGLGHVDQRPTVPGGPILVMGQRPPA